VRAAKSSPRNAWSRLAPSNVSALPYSSRACFRSQPGILFGLSACLEAQDAGRRWLLEVLLHRRPGARVQEGLRVAKQHEPAGGPQRQGPQRVEDVGHLGLPAVELDEGQARVGVGDGPLADRVPTLLEQVRVGAAEDVHGQGLSPALVLEEVAEAFGVVFLLAGPFGHGALRRLRPGA